MTNQTLTVSCGLSGVISRILLIFILLPRVQFNFMLDFGIFQELVLRSHWSSWCLGFSNPFPTPFSPSTIALFFNSFYSLLTPFFNRLLTSHILLLYIVPFRLFQSRARDMISLCTILMQTHVP